MSLSEAVMQNPRSISNQGTKLSLVDKCLMELDAPESSILQRVTHLYLSKNQLSDLSPLPSLFPTLRSLSLSHNSLTSYLHLRDVLTALPSLTQLRLDGNPVYDTYPSCRETLICELPLLRELDGKALDEGARVDAQVTVGRQRQEVEMMLENEVVSDTLNACDKKVKVHQQMS
jgi:Leucine-rich repeat (LRR) protein